MPKHRANHNPVPEEPTLEADLEGLMNSGRAALDSEWAFQKARAGLVLKLVAKAALWGGLALALLFFVLMALVVGALLGLSAWLGPWAATAIVVLTLLAIAAWCARRVLRAVASLGRIFGDEDAA
jgi:hypothetical protein